MTRSSIPTVEAQEKQGGRKPVKAAREAVKKPVTRKQSAPKAAPVSQPGPSTRFPRQAPQALLKDICPLAERYALPAY